MKVLIADDDPAIRGALTAQISGDGFETVACANGDDALSLLTGDAPPPIAILDWMMPKRTGLEVCRAIRTADLGLDPYLIILTAKIQPQDVVAALDMGADDYITKPFSMIELLARVRVGRRVAELQIELRDELAHASAASRDIEHLRQQLPVCMQCRRVFSDDASWDGIRQYLRTHAELSVGAHICPDCAAGADAAECHANEEESDR